MACKCCKVESCADGCTDGAENCFDASLTIAHACQLVTSHFRTYLATSSTLLNCSVFDFCDLPERGNPSTALMTSQYLLHTRSNTCMSTDSTALSSALCRLPYEVAGMLASFIAMCGGAG